MKLAEALVLRADYQKRIHQLQQRLNRSSRVQEGDTPPEDPQALLKDLDQLLGDLRTMIQRINKTNASVYLDDKRTLSDALAERDVLFMERNVIANLINEAAQSQQRYGRSEIKYVAVVDVAALQIRVDDISRRYRELDTAIQQANWLTDLV
jgi:type II secretory ATPase GspE/PulE/Tfp pilus assembly ATPase PilB-like protein